MSQVLPISDLARAANEARGLAMDAIHKCSSGHLGLPLGCAELGAVLYGHAMNFNPDESTWINRDRFILSAGHGSMFLYGWLHLSGFPGLDIDQVRVPLCRSISAASSSLILPLYLHRFPNSARFIP
jgi:transketolase